MASSQHRLSTLQCDVLSRFFAHEKRFFLTGGAALVGYYLHHRRTDDLDLFTSDPEAWIHAGRVIAATAEELGASCEVRQKAPDFQRHLLVRGDQSALVDLVYDRAPQLVDPKPQRNGVHLDPPEEILANKLCAVLSRAEERDLVDIMFLERAGYVVEEALAGALKKDGGCTPGQLAFVLSEIDIPNGIQLPADVPPHELREHLTQLITRLRRAALPASTGGAEPPAGKASP